MSARNSASAPPLVHPTPSQRPRALLSVSDKSGLLEFARELVGLGWELISTGGTLRALEKGGVPVIPVEEVTGFPEILSGRVKTLHPSVHAALLADRRRPEHQDDLARLCITPIDLLVVNFYPFAEAARNSALDLDALFEEIDIGGPAMVRAAAKNWPSVAVVVEPKQYPEILEQLSRYGKMLPDSYRQELALAAFRATAAYEAIIAEYLAARLEVGSETTLPAHLILNLERDRTLRYGENPHQIGGLFRIRGSTGPLGGFEALQGNELSFNNLLDADSARRLVGFLPTPAAVVVKHNNPSGAALGSTLAEALERAIAADPISAFGGVVALNACVDLLTAELLTSRFLEVVVAPEFTPEARDRLTTKSALRVLKAPVFEPRSPKLEFRSVDGGVLVQSADELPDEPESWTVVSRRAPTPEELAGLRFAWAVVRGIRSNAIVIANEFQTLGIGAGQMSRVDSCRLAISKASGRLAGSVAASDAFFPFRDGVDLLAQAGVQAIIQPGGSRRDPEVLGAADELGLAMVFTHRRHFRH